MTPTQTSAILCGNGLVTGQAVTAEITLLPPASGIRFDVNGVVIPAEARYVIDSFRGITLGRENARLFIVEHFLAACAMTQQTDLLVHLRGAPELPLLDGSAKPWVDFLEANFGKKAPASPKHIITEPISYQDPQSPEVQLAVLPSSQLQISYLMDIPHPGLEQRWFHWNPQLGDLRDMVAPARTYGFQYELPLMQAKGLAKGVNVFNTLGLLDDGSFSMPLRFADEPLRHKALDFIGDMMLCGLPILQLQGHFIVIKSGHTGHVVFGQQLARHFG